MIKFALALVLFSFQLRADSSALTSDFVSLLSKYKISPSQEQTYCYLLDGKVHGRNPQKMQRIASLTKILTTYFASELMDLHRTFETKIFIQGDSLHIEGGRDPYWEEDKTLLLLQTLNELGHKHFRAVTVDNNFLFSDVGFNSHADVTPAYSVERLRVILSKKSSSYVRSLWSTVQKFAAEEGITLSGEAPAVTASSVSLSSTNPLKESATQVYLHRSLPFHRLLKSMNVMSKNHVAQNVFREASTIQRFTDFMIARGFSANDFRIYNGSGLPVIDQIRLDNLASCELILRVNSMLEKSLSRHQLLLSDILAVNGGKDLGSFRKRFLEMPETHESVLSKTGTLKHTSSLAGMLMIGGSVPFAILNHTTNAASARSFQDVFVSRMFHHLGTATPIAYEKISIFPWDGSEFLRPELSQNFATNAVE